MNCNVFLNNLLSESDFDGLKAVFNNILGHMPREAVLLPGAGSNRKYYRLVCDNGSTFILTVGEDVAENRAFCNLSAVFSAEGVNVPQVLWTASDCRCYLQSDLGSVSLYDCITKSADECGDTDKLIDDALIQLIRMQTVDIKEWKDKVGFAPFSRRLVMWDLNYFKYEFLKPSGIHFDESALEDDFECFASGLLSLPEEYWGFMMRDFQSRNIMISEHESWLIDFQGGRFGPCIYDIVSFLWQAKAGFTAEQRQRWCMRYLCQLAKVREVNIDEVSKYLPLYTLFRTLQVLGAYGFRGLVEHKAHFIESIPAAMDNLQYLIDSGAADEYPELKNVCKALLTEKRFRRSEQRDGLTVEVFSFSYKKGYPEDLSGNGGGFMFDCRAMHNPGRYAEYKCKTGLDKGVIDFLEDRGEVQEFLKAAEALVFPAVERYVQRGFSKLQVGFGCTGGQHRSVYCAQHLADDLHKAYPDLRIHLQHREQRIAKKYNDQTTND